MIEHLILTGANGYIGARLAQLAKQQGRRVTVLGRRTGPHGARLLPWTLGDGLPPDALDPNTLPARQALVHLAHDWRDTADLNLSGTEILLLACRTQGLGRFIFVSSQSARQDAANIYGRTKWRIEQALEGENEASARVGLVYGGPVQAMYGLLATLTRKTPVLPMIDPWRPVQPIHLDEVCNGLLRLADTTGGGWHGLAAPHGIPFGDVLRAFARDLHGRRLHVLPVPLAAVLLACRVLDAVPFAPKIDRERVLGLAGTRPMDCAAHLQSLGLDVAPLHTGLSAEPSSRKAVLAEAHALLRFVLRRRPGTALLRRYARAVAQSGQPGYAQSGPLMLPGPIHGWPSLLRFIEPFRRDSRFGQRLAFATSLAEASPEGEAALAAGTRAGRLIALVADLALDVLAMPLRAMFARTPR